MIPQHQLILLFHSGLGHQIFPVNTTRIDCSTSRISIDRLNSNDVHDAFSQNNINLTSIGSNVAIRLANLLLSIRVQTMLLASTCHTMPLSAFKHGSHALKELIDVDIPIKNKQKVVQRGLSSYRRYCHHSGQNLNEMSSKFCGLTRLRFISSQHFDHRDDEYRCR